jgi:polysaccharide deacetylase family protein (PEP-CTERM system associated)
MVVTNIMTVDLEDYYCDLPFSEWSKHQDRIIQNTEVVLELFTKYKIKATFFVVGYIAEKFPMLIKKIFDQGHEIASHSYCHHDLRKINKDIFEGDLKKSIQILENITGEKVLGFRAPFFSIEKKTFWAIEILRKYVAYDSSIFPVRTPLYGVPNAPRNIYRPSTKNFIKEDKQGDLIEIPLATHKIPIIGNIPIAGGFHLRFLPHRYIAYGIKKMNSQNNPAMIYIHPKDLDPNMPKIKEYNWIYYHNLKSAQSKFEKILKKFEFTSVKELLKI